MVYQLQINSLWDKNIRAVPKTQKSFDWQALFFVLFYIAFIVLIEENDHTLQYTNQFYYEWY